MGRQIGRSREGIWKHSVQTPSADEIRFDQPIKSVAVGRVTRSNLNSAPETRLLFRSKIRLRCCCHPLHTYLRDTVEKQPISVWLNNYKRSRFIEQNDPKSDRKSTET